METLSAKQISDLAKTCRKAGIMSFKGFGVEFTLTPEAQKPARRNKKATTTPAPKMITVQGPNGPVQISAPVEPQKDDIETDELTRDELLFWSVGSGEESAQ